MSALLAELFCWAAASVEAYIPLKITFDLATMSILSCQQKTSKSVYMLTHHQQVVAFMNIIDQRILKREIKHFRLTVKEDER